jgi:predicted enzyme related to lactoylglutathione lyase
MALATPIGAQRGQQPPPTPVPGAAPAGAVLGVGTYIHLVSDVNNSLAFYGELLGVDPNANARGPVGPRVFAPNEVVSNLYNTPGALFRGGTVRIPNTELGGAELVDWQTSDRKRVQPRLQDAGALTLMLTVRDISVAAAALSSHGGSIITPKGQPVLTETETGKGLALLGRDPDGFLIGVEQPIVSGEAAATAGNVISTKLIVTVADLDKATRLYHDALGFDVHPVKPLGPDRGIAALAGLPGVQSRCAAALIPGTALTVEFVELKGVERKPLGADVHGVGSSVLRLRVKDIDATIAALKAAGVTVASANGQPVTFANGQRMAIMSDSNGIFVQVVQAAPPQPRPQN